MSNPMIARADLYDVLAKYEGAAGVSRREADTFQKAHRVVAASSESGSTRISRWLKETEERYFPEQVSARLGGTDNLRQPHHRGRLSVEFYPDPQWD